MTRSKLASRTIRVPSYILFEFSNYSDTCLRVKSAYMHTEARRKSHPQSRFLILGKVYHL